jgi:hypothetical protein
MPTQTQKERKKAQQNSDPHQIEWSAASAATALRGTWTDSLHVDRQDAAITHGKAVLDEATKQGVSMRDIEDALDQLELSRQSNFPSKVLASP